MRTLLCCIGRLENDYIREYVEYYKNLGFTNICLYDNNRDGEDDFHDVIGDYIDSGFVILKDYRNKIACQIQSYQECYDEYGHDYDWIAFFDIDEFLTFTKDKTIEEYLNRTEFNPYNSIQINWMCYGDGGMLRNDGRPLLERITEPLDKDFKTAYPIPENFHTKTILRGGLNNVKWGPDPHVVYTVKESCNAVGKEITVRKNPFVPYNYDLAYLKHFSTKTVDEYCNKMLRGFPDRNNNVKEIPYLVKTRFFHYNELTEEKAEIVKKRLNVDLDYLVKRKNIKKRKDVQIFNLCYSKKDYAFKEDSVITPLQVGAANGTDVCDLKDNTGENASSGNFFYIENTGTYWIWKNINDAKYKGQMQYRRLLHGIDENTDFEEIFKDHDVITCVPYHYPDHDTPQKDPKGYIPAKTVEKGYAFSNCFMDLSMLESVIKTNFPEYREDYDKYIKKGEDLYYSAGYIMRSEDYDRYAQFLFNCLGLWLKQTRIQTKEDLYFHVGRNFGMGFYSQRYPNPMDVPKPIIDYQTRIGGYLGERIFTLWIKHNFKPERIYETPYDKQEENQWI